MGACVSSFFRNRGQAEVRRTVHPPVLGYAGVCFSETQAPDAGFEVLTLPSLIGQIWLWRSEAIIIPLPGLPIPPATPPQEEYFVFL